MKYKYRQRNCDWCCKKWEDCETKPGYVQYVEGGHWEICGACSFCLGLTKTDCTVIGEPIC